MIAEACETILIMIHCSNYLWQYTDCAVYVLSF